MLFLKVLNKTWSNITLKALKSTTPLCLDFSSLFLGQACCIRLEATSPSSTSCSPAAPRRLSQIPETETGARSSPPRREKHSRKGRKNDLCTHLNPSLPCSLICIPYARDSTHGFILRARHHTHRVLLVRRGLFSADQDQKSHRQECFGAVQNCCSVFFYFFSL
jgi:hypothetical protein